MATSVQKAVAAGGVIVGIATAIVTNLITNRPSWSLATALAVLAAAGVWLALLTHTAPGRSRHRIRADHGGLIEHSGATGRDGADIEQIATRRGVITGSPITARDADVEQEADHGGHIVDSPSDMQ